MNSHNSPYRQYQAKQASLAGLLVGTNHLAWAGDLLRTPGLLLKGMGRATAAGTGTQTLASPFAKGLKPAEAIDVGWDLYSGAKPGLAFNQQHWRGKLGDQLYQAGHHLSRAGTGVEKVINQDVLSNIAPLPRIGGQTLEYPRWWGGGRVSVGTIARDAGQVVMAQQGVQALQAHLQKKAMIGAALQGLSGLAMLGDNALRLPGMVGKGIARLVAGKANYTGAKLLGGMDNFHKSYMGTAPVVSFNQTARGRLGQKIHDFSHNLNQLGTKYENFANKSVLSNIGPLSHKGKPIKYPGWAGLITGGPDSNMSVGTLARDAGTALMFKDIISPPKPKPAQQPQLQPQTMRPLQPIQPIQPLNANPSQMGRSQ